MTKTTEKFWSLRMRSLRMRSLNSRIQCLSLSFWRMNNLSLKQSLNLSLWRMK